MTRSRCRITHKLSYLGWDMLCTYARATRMRCQRKDRALVETRPASREKQFEKAQGPGSLFDHHLASEHRRIPPRPTRKARMFVGTSRASTHAESQPPFLQPNEVLGGASSACNSCNIYVSTDVACTRAHTRTSLAGLGSPHGKNATEILIALRSGGLSPFARYGNLLPSMASFTPGTSECK